MLTIEEGGQCIDKPRITQAAWTNKTSAAAMHKNSHCKFSTSQLVVSHRPLECRMTPHTHTHTHRERERERERERDGGFRENRVDNLASKSHARPLLATKDIVVGGDCTISLKFNLYIQKRASFSFCSLGSPSTNEIGSTTIFNGSILRVQLKARIGCVYV